MRDHVITGFIAAVLAIGASAAIQKHVAKPIKVIERQAVGKYGWGELSVAEQSRAAQLIGKLDRREVQIFCGTPGCADLGEDIDEVFDMTGAASNLQRPFVDLGAGMGISPDEPITRKIAAAFKEATQGRVDLQVIDQPQAGGGIVVALGRKPRK